jgi:hypothetical protein
MYTHFQASQTVEMAVPEPTLIHHYPASTETFGKGAS